MPIHEKRSGENVLNFAKTFHQQQLLDENRPLATLSLSVVLTLGADFFAGALVFLATGFLVDFLAGDFLAAIFVFFCREKLRMKKRKRGVDRNLGLDRKITTIRRIC